MPTSKRRSSDSLPRDPDSSAPVPAAAEPHPALQLGASLGLIALFILPALGGGYSGAGYQVGCVLLPVAAALCLSAAPLRPRLAVGILALVMLSGLVLAILGQFDPALWIQPGRELWFYALHLPAAWLVVWVTLTAVPQRAGLVRPALVAGTVLPALYGWWLWIGSGRLDYQNCGSFGLHNPFAGFLLPAWALAAFCALTEPRRGPRIAYTASAYFLALTLVLTYSRAAWLCFLLQLMVLGGVLLWRRFAAGQKLGRSLLLAAAGLPAMLLILLIFPPVRDVLLRLLEWQGHSMQGRLRFWSAALEIFRDHPLGIGLGNFAFVYPQYQRDWLYYSVDPHSWALQLLCELGVLGGLAALVLLAAFGIWKWRLWRASGGSLSAALLIVGVAGSLLHALVDFDYTFGATLALLGAMFALGAAATRQARQPSEPLPAAPPAGESSAPSPLAPAPLGLWPRALTIFTVLLLLCAAVYGERLTAERYVLDRLRDTPGLPLDKKQELLTQAIRYNPSNFRTHFQLATLLAQKGPGEERGAAQEQVRQALRLNPRFAKAWALQGLLRHPPAAGDADVEHALELDKYNFPEHYFFWANLTDDDQVKRERLLLGLERIPAHDPITLDHLRAPDWYELNPVFAEWYFELARLTPDGEEKQQYLSTGARFKAFWDGVLKERGQSSAPPAKSEAST